MTSRGPILHVAPFLWSGAGGVITRLCEAQRSRRPVVIVTTSRSGGLRDWPDYRRRLRRAGVEHRTVDVFHRDAGTFWAGSEAFARLLDEVRPSVVHAHAGVPTCSAVVARDRSGVAAPIIAQMYSWGPERPAWMDQQDLWGFSRADRVVCSARAYHDVLVEGGVPRAKTTYLPWGLPLEELPFRAGRPTPRRHLVSAARRPAIGFVGRIEPRKGQLLLVEALPRIRARVPGATLELVGPPGDTAYEAELRRRVSALGLDDAVTLPGRVRRVFDRLRTWDIFVSVSSDEGQGLAVLEALAAGVPVVARVVPGVEDFLRPAANCHPISGPTPRHIADAVVDALADPVRLVRFAVAGRRLVERRYDWAQTVASMERVYRLP